MKSEGMRGQQRALEGRKGKEGEREPRAFSDLFAFIRHLRLLMPSLPSLPSHAFLPLLLALATFLLYVRTLAPDVVDGDGGEFQFAAWNFSFVHPTGYPLYLIFGGLFQHLIPIGNPAYRLNLFTAMTGALAVGAIYLLVNELTRKKIAGVVAAASFAITRTFWFDTSAAEVYALSAFFVAILIYLALRWQSEPSAKNLAVFCFAFALALTHHRSIVLWIPGFALFCIMLGWRHRARISFARLTQYAARNMLFLAAPLALYLYIPLIAPQSPYYALALSSDRKIFLYDDTLDGFINYVSGSVFQFEIRWDAVSIARMISLPNLLHNEFGIIGLALGVLGIVKLIWDRDWTRFAFFASGFLLTVLFASIYHIGDISHYYIPAYLVWAIWIGVAISAIAGSAQVSKLRGGIAAIVALALALYLLITNYPFADRSRETQSREQWDAILAAPIPSNAILISNDRDEIMPLWYIQYVENTRRDLLGLFPLITPAREFANVGRLTDTALETNRPVFFIKPMPGIEIKYRLEATPPPLVRVAGRAIPLAPQFSSNALLANRVRVIGYDVSRAPGGLRVAVFWQLKSGLERDYTTFVHLLDARGDKIAQSNDHQVGGEFYPTSLWDVGEILRDEHFIALGGNFSPGVYRFVVGMYRFPDMEMLDDPVEIGVVELK